MEIQKKMKFKSGDVVKCKSHEHKMVVKCTEENDVMVDYFIGKKHHSEKYSMDELQHC